VVDMLSSAYPRITFNEFNARLCALMVRVQGFKMFRELVTGAT
jgi:hypothetical protein